MGNQTDFQKQHKELITKVTMYLDNELTKEAERDLLKEIKQNPAYIKLLNEEKSFRDFIKSRIHRRKVSPTLIASIKERIKISAPPVG